MSRATSNHNSRSRFAAIAVALVSLFTVATAARADVQEGVQFSGPEQTGQMALDLAGSLSATEPITGIIGIDNIPEQTLVIEVVDGPVQSDLSPATAGTDCQGLASSGATIETGASGELVDVRGLVLELFSEDSLTLGVEELELRICLTERCGGVGEILVKVNADADVDSILFCQEGSATLTATGQPGEYEVTVSGSVVVAGEWRAPLRVSGIPIPLSDDYDFDVPITLTGTARQSARGLTLDLSQLVNPSIQIEYDVAVELEDDPPLIVDADGFLAAEATAGLGLAFHLQSFSNIVPPGPDEGFPFEVTRFSNVQMVTQDRLSMRADFEAPIPARDDVVTISLDGQEIFSDKFRTFNTGIFGDDDVFTNSSLLGLDVELDFGSGEMRVSGTTRPKIDADLEDGLTVKLELGNDFGSDTVEIDVFLLALWSLAECSMPGVVDGDSCNRGDGVCDAGFCQPVGQCADVDCNDDNECTKDVCDPGDGSCSYFFKADGSSCADGTGACLAGTCLPNSCDCDDGNECTEDTCDPADASCSSSPVADGTICSGGVCDGGVCTDFCSVDVCDDDEACTFDLCNPNDGSCYNPPKVNGLPCDAGGFAGTCSQGECVPLGDCCNDLNECTSNICNPDGTCDNPAVTDGTLCDGGEGTCQAGTCVSSDVCLGVVCDQDPNDCVVGTCFENASGAAECAFVDKPANAECLFGPFEGACTGDGLCEPLSGCCNDLNICTSNICNEDGSCGNPALPDGTPCDVDATCQAGLCTSTDPCDGVVCDQDPNDCVVGTCFENASGAAECAFADKPANAECLFGPFEGACTGDGLCEPLSGCCGDQNECTSDICNEDGSCDYVDVLDGTLCDGGNGACKAGTCVDPCEGVVCDDSNECTENVCVAGACPFTPLPDGTACDGGAGSCQAGSCQALGDAFEVTKFTNVQMVTQSRISLRANFDAGKPDNDDVITITLDGREVFSEKFRTFRSGLFGDGDTYSNDSLLGLDVTLDFGDGELRVSGTTRPKLDGDTIDDGLTVTLDIGDSFSGTDTVPIDVFLGILWSIDD